MGWGEGCIEDIFANAAEHFVQLIPLQVEVYFFGRGTNRRLWAAQQPLASFVRGDVFRQSTSDGSTQPSLPIQKMAPMYGNSSKLVRLIPNMEQQRQIGEAYTTK